MSNTPQGFIDHIVHFNIWMFQASIFFLAGLWFWPPENTYPFYGEMGLMFISGFFFVRTWQWMFACLKNAYAYERSEAQTKTVKSKGREQSSDHLASTEDLEKAGLL